MELISVYKSRLKCNWILLSIIDMTMTSLQFFDENLPLFVNVEKLSGIRLSIAMIQYWMGVLRVLWSFSRDYRTISERVLPWGVSLGHCFTPNSWNTFPKPTTRSNSWDSGICRETVILKRLFDIDLKERTRKRWRSRREEFVVLLIVEWQVVNVVPTGLCDCGGSWGSGFCKWVQSSIQDVLIFLPIYPSLHP